MINVESGITIDRPAAEIFPYVADLTTSPEWCPIIKTIRRTRGEPDEPGTEYVSIETPLVFPMKSHYRILRVKEPDLLEWSFSNTLVSGTGRYGFESREGKTVMKQVNEVRLRGPLKLFSKVLRKMAGGYLDDQNRRLKAILERRKATALGA